MENLQSILSVTLELIVTIFVATLVWITLVAGLYQVVRDWIGQTLLVSQRRAQERYVQRTEAAPQVAHPQPTTWR